MSKNKPLTQGQLESLIIYACRYCIGRSTYAPHEFMDIVEPRLAELTDGTLACLDRDIEREGQMWGFGMEMDRARWYDFLDKLKAVQQSREANNG